MPLLKETNLITEIRADEVVLHHDYIAAQILYDSPYMGQFYIPKEYRERTRLAKVLNTGVKYDGPVRAGDYIVYGAWEGVAWPGSPNEDVILLRPANVHAIIEP